MPGVGLALAMNGNRVSARSKIVVGLAVAAAGIAVALIAAPWGPAPHAEPLFAVPVAPAVAAGHQPAARGPIRVTNVPGGTQGQRSPATPGVAQPATGGTTDNSAVAGRVVR